MTVRRHLIPLLMALPVRPAESTSGRAQCPQIASSSALYYLPHTMRRPALHAGFSFSRRGRLVLQKNTPCSDHRLVKCPVCQPAEYMQRRVVKAVSSALKRMGLQKTQPILTYLGADSWVQVLQLLDAKRDSWNLLYPDTPMTPTNTALDHIRPVHAFSKEGHGAQTLLCNHYTNLKPLLHEDNAWKGDNWSAEDERVWHERIILKTDYDKVYYPHAAPAQPSLLFARQGGK